MNDGMVNAIILSGDHAAVASAVTAQIAAELGLTERGVEGRLYRLRQKLRRLLGGDFCE